MMRVCNWTLLLFFAAITSFCNCSSPSARDKHEAKPLDSAGKLVTSQSKPEETLYEFAASLLDSNWFDKIVPERYNVRIVDSGNVYENDFTATIRGQKISFSESGSSKWDVKQISLRINGQKIDFYFDEEGKSNLPLAFGSIEFEDSSSIPYYNGGDKGVFFILKFWDPLTSGVYRYINKGFLIHVNGKKATATFITSYGAFRDFYFSHDSNGKVFYLSVQPTKFPQQDYDTVHYDLNVLQFFPLEHKFVRIEKGQGKTVHAIVTTPDMFADSVYTVVQRN